MRAAIYTRASLDRTGEGKSNARQRDECQRLIDFKRWETVAVEEDVSISAYGEKERPAWLRVLGMVEANEVDVVVAFHLDRLTRNMADLEKLILLCEQKDVLVATATGDMDLTNDTGRMVARILAAVARQEVERKAARQKLAHAQRRAEGRPWSAVKMLGYARNGDVIEHEAEAIRDAVRDVLEDRASLSEVGRRWHELGLTSPYKDDSKPWTPNGVKKILTNPRLAGFVTKNDEVLGEGQWEPIISESDLALLVAKMADPRRRRGSNKGGRYATNLLSGVMRCVKCGKSVRAGAKRGVTTYICPDWHVAVPRDDADALVTSAFAATVATVSPNSVLDSGVVRVDDEAVRVELGELRERQQMLVRSFAAGSVPSSAFEGAAKDLAAKIEELEQGAITATRESDWLAIRSDQVTDFLHLDTLRQRDVLLKTCEVTLHPVVGPRSTARGQVEVKVRARRGDREVLLPAYAPEHTKAPAGHVG